MLHGGPRPIVRKYNFPYLPRYVRSRLLITEKDAQLLKMPLGKRLGDEAIEKSEPFLRATPDQSQADYLPLYATALMVISIKCAIFMLW